MQLDELYISLWKKKYVRILLFILVLLWVFWGIRLYKDGVAIEEKKQNRLNEQRIKEESNRRKALLLQQSAQQNVSSFGSTVDLIKRDE